MSASDIAYLVIWTAAAGSLLWAWLEYRRWEAEQQEPRDHQIEDERTPQ